MQYIIIRKDTHMKDFRHLIHTLLMAALLLTGLTAMAAPAWAEDAPRLESLEQRASYALGIDIGNKLQGQFDGISVERVLEGYRDAIAGNPAKIGTEEFTRILMETQTKLQAEAQARMAADGQANREAGEQFLARNAKKAGIKALPSGVQYKVLASGTGASPKATDTVVVHYEGRLIDGTVFDSSIKRGEPATFPLTGVITGFSEALQTMKVGDKWEVYIPSDLAYGESAPSPEIGPNSTLIFVLELIKIKG
jgi:FKBP-type peptidyl-prolyl cis-trans isomerase FklB